MKTRYFPVAAFEKAIAYSFLNLTVTKYESASTYNKNTLLSLEESGLLKLEVNGSGFRVKIPFVFLRCYFETVKEPFAKYWSELLIEKKIYWQEWETFNRNYLAFRLSLFAALGYKKIRLDEFFHGCLTNIPDNIELLIPPMEIIQVVDAKHRYPKFKLDDLPAYSFVLNADGAAFDAFVFVTAIRKNVREVSEEMVLALQMKFSNSAHGQTITNQSINDEYKKVNNAMSKFAERTDFTLVMFGRCELEKRIRDGKIKLSLPSKVALVTMSEHRQFYGDFYSHRLSHPI